MAEPTPTPWMWDDGAIFAHGEVVCRAPEHPDNKVNWKINAPIIVKAANAHDALVKALMLAEDVLSRAPFSTDIWPNGMHPQRGIEQIRAALTSIKES